MGNYTGDPEIPRQSDTACSWALYLPDKTLDLSKSVSVFELLAFFIFWKYCTFCWVLCYYLPRLAPDGYYFYFSGILNTFSTNILLRNIMKKLLIWYTSHSCKKGKSANISKTKRMSITKVKLFISGRCRAYLPTLSVCRGIFGTACKIVENIFYLTLSVPSLIRQSIL